ncbi:MAG: methyltransferase domain-containing protein [Rhizobiales bacterium]|nr:methyltransferase domain-containing protein [Hyphomicrobiales bacterium]
MSGTDDDREQRLRAEGRANAYALQQEAEAAGTPFSWFDALYRKADGEPGLIPWEKAAPRFRLAAWLADNPGAGRRAIDVGCGLGDNARMIAEAGWQVTAFDIAETAVAWAARRHAGIARLSFVAADLLSPPADWRGAFDLVHETYNLQAMPRHLLARAVAALPALVAPGGRLLLMTRFADPDREAPPPGPPWPLTEADLAPLERAGLVRVEAERFDDRRDPPIPHLLALYERAK